MSQDLLSAPQYHGQNQLVNTHSPLSVAQQLKGWDVTYARGCNICDWVPRGYPNMPWCVLCGSVSLSLCACLGDSVCVYACGYVGMYVCVCVCVCVCVSHSLNLSLSTTARSERMGRVASYQRPTPPTLALQSLSPSRPMWRFSSSVPIRPLKLKTLIGRHSGWWVLKRSSLQL